MTYRELIEICNKTPDEDCKRCEYKKECETFDISELYGELYELESKIKEIYHGKE